MNLSKSLFGVAFFSLAAFSYGQNPFLTGFALNGPPLRNDYGNFVGMKFTVGTNALLVSSVGRICVAGNAQAHIVKFVLGSNGADVPGATASVNMAGCTVGGFAYTPLGSPITLAANTSYFLVSQETVGGDKWYDYGTVTSTADAVVNSSVYFYSGNYLSVGSTNSSYAPPNFQYTVVPPPPTPGFIKTYNLNNRPLRNDYTGFVGMQLTVGSTPLSVTALGRVCVAGNSQTHIVKFAASNGTDVPGAAASVNMTGCTPGAFSYTTLGSPVNLSANTTYFLVSQEANGGDQWYDQGQLTTKTDAAVNRAVYTNGTSYITIGAANTSYVPPDFQYSTSGGPCNVTVGTNPAGLSFTVDSLTYSSSQTFPWTCGSTHNISTTSPQNVGGGSQQVFSSWSDAGAISHSVSPTSATTYTATFTTQYLLTTSVSPGGSGSIVANPSSVTGYYNAGTPVQLTANSNSGFTFANWSGDLSGSTNPQSITMSAPHSVTANFSSPPPISVTVGTNPSTLGLSFTVDSVTYTATHIFSWAPGSSHTIATTSPQLNSAGSQQAFSSWSDAGAISHSVAPTTATTYTATFVTQYLLTTGVSPGGSGGIVANPLSVTGYYNAGTSVQLTASPNGGFTFSNWGGDLSGTANPQSITMSAPHSVTANFTGSPSTTFLTSYTSTAPLRNDYTGFVGMRLTVGATALPVVSLGRICVAGNSQTHTVKFVLASSGADVPGASASVNMSGCTPGNFVFTPVGPVTLAANTMYYLVSQETAGGDRWYEQASVSGMNVASINSSVYSFGSTYYPTNSANTSYVPPNFTYSLPSGPSPPAFVTAYSLNSPQLRNDFSGFVGMKLTIGATPITSILLGRVCVAGNSMTHVVEFVNANNNVVVGSATVNMAGCTPGQFAYAAPSSPILLQANGTYYLASQETVGGDRWYDAGTISTTNVATVSSAVYFYSGSWIIRNSGPNMSYVPPNFIYQPQGTPIILVTASRAPNYYVSPSWTGYLSNAINALENGLTSIGNPASDPTAYFQVTRENERQNIVSPFASWLGYTPTGAFVNEGGNRLHFGLHIIGNGVQFSLSQLAFDLESTDPTDTFQYTGNFSDTTDPTNNYSGAIVGLNYGLDRMKGTGDDFFVTSGLPTQIVDELFYVGIGVAIEPLDLSCSGTNQAMLDCVASYYTSIIPFSLSAVYTLNGSTTGSAAISFIGSQQNPNSIVSQSTFDVQPRIASQELVFNQSSGTGHPKVQTYK